MAQSFAQYIGDGTTRMFPVPFDYINKADLTVYVGNVPQGFTWNGPHLVVLAQAPVANAIVEVRRTTVKNKPIVDFVDGSTLTERDLDLTAKQLLLIAQENVDETERSIRFDAAGIYDLKGMRLTGLPDAVSAADAVNRRTLEAVVQSRINLGSALGAFVQFPLGEGGVSRSVAERFQDSIVLNDLSDGSGGAANDDAAWTTGLALAQETRRPLLMTRDFKLLAEKDIKAPVCVVNPAPGVVKAPITGNTLYPLRPMRSCFNVLSDGVSFHNLQAYSPANPNQTLEFFNADGTNKDRLNCPDGPDFLFRVEKTGQDGYFKAHNLQAYGFPVVIDWVDGIRAYIDTARLIKCGLFANFRNNGVDSYFRDVCIDYGALFRTDVDERREGHGTNGGQQGMEGASFYGCRATETPGPAFGYKYPGIWLKTGYALDFFQVQSMQRYYSHAILIDGGTRLVRGLNFFSPYCDIHGGTLGAGQTAAALSGIVCSGHVTNVKLYGPNVNGATGPGIILNGANATQQIYQFLISGYDTLNNIGGDLFAANCTGVVVASSFNSDNFSVYEVTNSTVSGQGNFFVRPPSKISLTSNWLANDGPGAPVGIPAAADAAGLGRGRFFYATDATVKITGA